MKNKNRFLIYLFVLIMGVLSMTIEMALSRLLAPYYGSSLIVWGAIIGVVLISLSLGYYFGGILSDRKPEKKELFKIGIIASLLISIVTVFFDALFWKIKDGVLLLDRSGLMVGLLILSLILFAIPVFFFGMICPFAVRVITKEVKESGQDAGKIFALSTIGSILGVFIPSFLTIPYLGTRETIFIFAGLGLLPGILFFRKRVLVFGLLALPIICYLLSNYLYQKKGENDLLVLETSYQHVKVQKIEYGEDFGKQLVINSGLGVQSLHLENKETTGHYWDAFSILPYLQKGDKKRDVLILGMAGGSISRTLRAATKDDFDYDLTGVEIDPKIKEIAESEFGINENIIVDDARAFLLKNKKKYDLIFIDAYGKEMFIPPHLSSKEFFNLVSNRLKENGIAAVNINSASKEDKLYLSLTSTFGQAFSHSYASKAGELWNYLLFGSNQKLDFHGLKNIKDGDLKKMAEYASEADEIEVEKKLILTDNKSAVEQLTIGMYFRSTR